MPRYDDRRYDDRRYDDRRYDERRNDRYDDRDRYGTTRLYVGHLGSRTRSRDLEELFSRYGRVRDVDLKHDFAFIEFSDPRDADDARYNLNGRTFDGTRIVVEFAKGGPRGSGGSREYLGRGPPPGSGRCFNCGLDGHWARDCKAGDWKNKCYRCGQRGHIERNCQNSPKPLKRGSSYSRSPSRSPRRERSYSRSRSYSQSRSPARRGESVEDEGRRSRSPRSFSPSEGKKHSSTPEENSPQERGSPPTDRRGAAHEDDSDSPRGAKSMSPSPDRGGSPPARRYRSSEEANDRSGTRSPAEDRSPVEEEEDDRRDSPRGSESP